MKKFLFLICSMVAIVLSGCSQGTILPEIAALNLSINAPNGYVAGTAITMPVVITNTGISSLDNISYSIVDISAGTGVTITPDSAANCKTLTPQQQCILQVSLPASSSPGAFTIVASSSLANTIAKAQTVVGLTQSQPNTAVGINGVYISYNNTVSVPNNYSGTTVVSMTVTSADAGVFNTFDLVDSAGNSIPYQVLTGNSGTGMTALSQGSVVSLAVNVPSGATQLSFYPSLKMNGSVITDGQSTTPIIINILRPSVPFQASLSMIPSNFSLSASNPTQVLTIVNVGDGAASSIVLGSLVSPMSIQSQTCGSTLEPGSSCSYTLGFDVNSTKAGTSVVVLDYNTGTTSSSDTSTFTYRGNNAVAEITLSSGSNPNFNFTTTTESPTTSSIVTLTNSGAVTVESFNFTLPTGFSTSPAITNPCTPGISLAAEETCDVILNYTSYTATPATTSTVELAYKYNDPVTQVPLNGSSIVGLTYQTIQSNAILSSSSGSVNFGNLSNNDSDVAPPQMITITNQGTAPTGGIPNISLENLGSIYNQSNTCTTILNPGDSCSVTITSGPVPTSKSAGNESNVLLVDYVPYARATTTNRLTTQLNTQVFTAQTAVIDVVQTSTSGFAAGTGIFGSPLMLESGATGTVTYTVTNSGTIPANNFNLMCNTNSCTSVLLPWTLTNNCPAILNAGQSCTAIYSLANKAPGVYNLPLPSINIQWVDQDSPSGQSQLFANNVLYTNVYASAMINLIPNPLTIAQGGAESLIATLSGGYNVSNQIITLIDNTAGALASIVNNPCTVNQTTPTCIFTLTANTNALPGTYSLGVTNSGNIPVSSNIPLTIVIPWLSLGSPNFSPVDAYYYSFEFNKSNSQPYVAYRDSSNGDRVTVVRYDGTNWVNVGDPGFSTKIMYGPSLAFNPSTNQPYVAYPDDSPNLPRRAKVTVMRYDGTNWVNVGISGFSAGGYVSKIKLAFNPSTNQPYVAYQDEVYGNRVTVMRYDGSNWVNVGSPGFSPNGAYNSMELAFDPSTNQPYVAYVDNSSGKLTVMMFDGTSWLTVGNSGFSPKNSSTPSLAFNPLTNQPYVGFSVSNNSAVMMFDGTSWVNVGSKGPYPVQSVQLEFNPLTSQPYLATCSTQSLGSKISMMYYPSSN